MNRTREALLRHSLQDIQEAPGTGTGGKSAALDPFLTNNGPSAADYHSRQESADSGVGLNSNYSLPHTPEGLLSPMDDQMDSADGRWRRHAAARGTSFCGSRRVRTK